MKNKRPSAPASGRGSRPDKKQSKPEGRFKRTASDKGEKSARTKAESEAGPATGERIAKRLARAGVASRRDAEAMIAEGRVKVNGKVLSSPAFNISAGDKVEVDGAPLPEVERTRLFLFHKPAGVVTTTRDPEGRPTIFETLPKGLPRLVTVGRLDINTEGLMLLTNDGGLSRVLELPTTGWLRRYRVRVHGHVEPSQLAELEKGIAVDGVFYGSIEATLDRTQGANSWLTLGFREGKNREVKNVLGALGLQVTRLIRISFGPFQLGDLPEGAVQEVKGRTLREQLGERLVEAAGANFDAPVAVPFANRPVRAGEEREDKLTEKKRERSSDGRAPTNKKRAREEHREDVRERLQTKPPRRGEDGRPDRPARAGRPEREAGDRRSDAPSGARSGGKRFERAEGPEGRHFDKPRGAGGDKPFRERRPEGDDRGPRRPRPSQGERYSSEGREGSRFDKPRGAGGDKPFRERRPEGDDRGPRRPRPSQGERYSSEGREGPRFDKPRGADGDRPFRERRPEGDDRGPRRPRPSQGERYSSEGREGSRFDKPRGAGGDKPFRERRPEGDERGTRGSRPGQGDRPGFKSKGGDDRSSGKGAGRDDSNRSRTAHVWMAPGARPVGKKPEEKAAEERPDRRTERSRTGTPRKTDEGKRGASSKDRPRSDRPRNGPSKPRPSGKR